MPQTDLEDLVGRTLRALPVPRAPQTLLPRVLEAVRHREQGGTASGWRSWPLGVQVASGVLCAAAMTAGLTVGPDVRVVIADLLTAMWAGTLALAAGPVAEAADMTRRADAGLELVRILWRVVVAPLVAYAAVIFVLTCLVCAGVELSLTWPSRKASSS